jgi:hypothetical protein
MKSQFFLLYRAPKKNWLFFGEAGAGERGAILYTVIESCRRRGIDPYAYLKDVLTRLPSMSNRQLVLLLPESWGRCIAPPSEPLHNKLHTRQTMTPMRGSPRVAPLVLRGYYRSYGVPSNINVLGRFRIEVTRLWFRSLRRRS